MNYIEALMKKHKNDRLWFYLAREETIQRFKEDLLELNVTWVDKSFFKKNDNVSTLMAVHDDMSIAFVSNLSWSYSFHLKMIDGKNIIRIDYQKLIDRDDSYYINKAI